MIERESLAIARFTNSLTQSYPPSTPYLIHPDGREVVGNSSNAFRNSRETMMESLLLGRAYQEEMSQALALEYFVNLALRVPLDGTGFILGLSPQSMEKSDEQQKGVDLLFTDTDNFMYLGIDVKLRKGRSGFERDGYGWNKNLLSPFIYLSLGNFIADTREQKKITVREWLRNYAIPKIGTSGKIPHIDQFRSYLITRIERSITGGLERLRECEDIGDCRGLPQTKYEQNIFEEKLAVMQSLFYELKQL